jgi:hypothetical protein
LKKYMLLRSQYAGKLERTGDTKRACVRDLAFCTPYFVP